jgi:hypothetical protein
VYYVTKGRVLLHLSSPAGKQLAIDIIQSGELIGFGALRKESFHSFDATTLSACDLRCLPAACRQPWFRRAKAARPMGRWETVTFIAVLRQTGIVAPNARAAFSQFIWKIRTLGDAALLQSRCNTP